MVKKIVGVCIGLGVAAGLWFLLRGGSEAENGELVRPARVERGLLRTVVAATGEIQPLRQVELKSKASGEVVRFEKREGDGVDEKELVAELDERTEQRNLRRAEADRISAEAQLQLTRLQYENALKNAQAEHDSAQADALAKKVEYDRLKELSGSVSQQELAQAKLNEVLSQESLKKARANLDLVRDRKEADEKLAEARLIEAKTAEEDAQDRLDDTEILSPIKGILLQKLVEEGQIVSSGISAASGGTPIAVVADVSKMVVKANIDETDIGKVRKGLEVELTVDAHPRKIFRGEVDLIPPRGELDSNIRVYKVEITVGGPDLELLKTGMTANVEIIIERRENVLLIPSEAIRRDEEGTFAYVSDGSSRARRSVKVGQDNGDKAEVLEGLKENEEILIVFSPEEQGGGGRWGRRRR